MVNSLKNPTEFEFSRFPFVDNLCIHTFKKFKHSADVARDFRGQSSLDADVDASIFNNCKCKIFVNATSFPRVESSLFVFSSVTRYFFQRAGFTNPPNSPIAQLLSKIKSAT